MKMTLKMKTTSNIRTTSKMKMTSKMKTISKTDNLKKKLGQYPTAKKKLKNFSFKGVPPNRLSTIWCHRQLACDIKFVRQVATQWFLVLISPTFLEFFEHQRKSFFFANWDNSIFEEMFSHHSYSRWFFKNKFHQWHKWSRVGDSKAIIILHDWRDENAKIE